MELSMNKSFKDKLSSEFSKWYTQEVSKKIDSGMPVEEVYLDMRMSVIKELSSRLFISAHS